jgi:hypothetical protein
MSNQEETQKPEGVALSPPKTQLARMQQQLAGNTNLVNLRAKVQARRQTLLIFKKAPEFKEHLKVGKLVTGKNLQQKEDILLDKLLSNDPNALKRGKVFVYEGWGERHYQRVVSESMLKDDLFTLEKVKRLIRAELNERRSNELVHQQDSFVEFDANLEKSLQVTSPEPSTLKKAGTISTSTVKKSKFYFGSQAKIGSSPSLLSIDTSLPSVTTKNRQANLYDLKRMKVFSLKKEVSETSNGLKALIGRCEAVKKEINKSKSKILQKQEIIHEEMNAEKLGKENVALSKIRGDLMKFVAGRVKRERLRRNLANF